jgi:hypothetical protein
LVNSYLDIEHEKYLTVINSSSTNGSIEAFNTLENEQELLEEQMLAKTNNIKHVLTALDMSEASIKAEKDVLAKYKNDLQAKQTQIQKAKDRVKKLIVDIVEHAGEPTKTGGMTIKTDLGKFTTYETAGKLIVKDADDVPEKFVKITKSVDKTKLRKHMMENLNGAIEYSEINSDGVEYASIKRERRLKIYIFK